VNPSELRARPFERSGYCAQRTGDGSWTVIDPQSGRAAHDLHGARSEARVRFVQALGLDRAPRGATLRLLDVGTGLGLNLAAALEAAQGCGARLEVLCLERDPAPLELAAELEPDSDPGFDAHWRRALAALSASRERGGPAEVPGVGTVELALGDAAVELSARPQWRGEGIFLDGYAPRDGGALWSFPFLRALAAALVPGGRLATYTASAAVRAALLAAGLELRAGPRHGAKVGGTVALRAPVAGGEPGGEHWPRGLWSELDSRQGAKLARRAARLPG
jgi:tRNA U34 5-methylaminomethyl-2-thiouridine-forming methyltransferase MnmC